MKPLVTLALSALLLAAPAARAAMPPDIVLVLVDSLRADALDCYGFRAAHPASPRIDALAASGTLFLDAASSAPWTQPSVMSLFTSADPAVHGRVLPSSHTSTNVATLAGILRAAGYQTAAVTANPMTQARYGYARGFDFYDDYTVQINADNAAAAVGTDAVVTREARRILASRDPARPLFLFLLYMDVHWDYLPPPETLRLFTSDPVSAPGGVQNLDAKYVPPAVRRRVRDAYAGEVRHTDSHVGELLDALAASPRAPETAVILCADHGDAFWEHGQTGHGKKFHPEETHVPLVMRVPGHTRPGGVVTGLVGLVDVAPTLAAAAGLPAPPFWSGRSLLPLLGGGRSEGRAIPQDNQIIGGHSRAVVTDRWRLVARPPFEALSGLYDRLADPAETNNLAASPIPDEVKALMPLLRPQEGESP